MHRASLAIIAVPLILLAATVAISTLITEDVFARGEGRYSGGDGTSQAASVSNECLNPILDSNTIDNLVGVGNCGGTISQQDESGSASAPITSQTANPDIELQRATTTQPPSLGGLDECLACFLGPSGEGLLTPDEQEEFLDNVNEHFPTIDTSMGFLSALNQLCPLLDGSGVEDLEEVLIDSEVDLNIIQAIIECLLGA
jgi:hypothetical protein